MRILWLKSDLLLPLDKGGKLRTWHLMRHLARRHDITYLAFAEPDTPREHIDGMREVCTRIETVTRSAYMMTRPSTCLAARPMTWMREPSDRR